MKAFIVLANGMVFEGESFGAEGTRVGEVVFSTAMAGYEETLTDPSYYGQIITQTYPMIGNYGVNGEDAESARIWAFGYIVREACEEPSNFRCKKTISAFLKEQGIIGVSGVDTRRLTRILRESGVMNGAVTTEYESAEAALARRGADGSASAAYAVTDAVDSVTAARAGARINEDGRCRVALFDFGCKRNILRSLVARGCRVAVVPAAHDAPQELAALGLDGIMLSNGPGDPAENVPSSKTCKAIAQHGPARLRHLPRPPADGARPRRASTEKLKYGHRGVNQPVTDLAHGRTYITSQNHGYAVVGRSRSTRPMRPRSAHVNANDGTVEGLRYKDIPLLHRAVPPGGLRRPARHGVSVRRIHRHDAKGGSRRCLKIHPSKKCSSSAPAPSSSARRPSSTTPARRRAAR